MCRADGLAGRLLGAPPAIVGIGPAQIDHAADAMPAQERRQEARIGLGRARRFAGHDPVVIVENVAGAAHGGCVAARAILRKSPEQFQEECAAVFRPELRPTTRGFLRIHLNTLIRLWIWVTLMAVAALVLRGVQNSLLKSATGFGVVDLQGMNDAGG